MSEDPRRHVRASGVILMALIVLEIVAFWLFTTQPEISWGLLVVNFLLGMLLAVAAVVFTGDLLRFWQWKRDRRWWMW